MDFSHFDLEYISGDDDEENGKNKCSFDAVTIEELDEVQAVVNSAKYCDVAPKPAEISKTVVIK